VAVQLIAQEAKAYARMGQRDEMNNTLERGRLLLDKMPYPENVDNHFVVDPAKFDFYAMDCYREIGDDNIARTLADEIIRTGTDFDGRQRVPMRVAEAQVTLGVAAARQGDLDEAISRGQMALSGDRQSLPTLAMVSRDLATVLGERYRGEPEAVAYIEELRSIGERASAQA
jgi:tetratricopeptide (TPR) repeat protein